MHLDEMIPYAAGVIVLGVGAWIVRSLTEVTRTIAVVQSELKQHSERHDESDERHASHDVRGFDHERRIVRIETRGEGLPRPG